MIVPASIKSISQGTIFSCGYAEDYHGCNVHGLVITARCDIAHDKAPIYNYLPIVGFADWIRRDGRLLICSRARQDSLGKLRNQLKPLTFSGSILEVESPRRVYDILIAGTDSAVPLKQRTAFLGCLEQYELAEAALSANPSDSVVLTAMERFDSIRDSLVRELCSERLNGFYFLPSIEPRGDNRGYVVLLREIRHVPRVTATAISRGLTATEYQAMVAQRPMAGARLSFDVYDFAMPVGQLASPHLEHLIQTLSLLFSRIGLPDLDPEYVTRLWPDNCPVTGSVR